MSLFWSTGHHQLWEGYSIFLIFAAETLLHTTHPFRYYFTNHESGFVFSKIPATRRGRGEQGLCLAVAILIAPSCNCF